MTSWHPDSLQSWINKIYLDENGEVKKNDLIYYKGAVQQATWVRDHLTSITLHGVNYEQRKDGSHVKVISSHKSKSCPLPVYSLEPPGKGIRFILRGNFYNWKASVISDKPVNIDPNGLFRGVPPVAPEYSGHDLHPVYFEGFPQNLIFGYYVQDNQKFSAQLNDESLWSFIFLCMRSYEGDRWLNDEREKDEEYKLKAAAYQR